MCRRDKKAWQTIASTLKHDFGQHRCAVEVMEYYQRSINPTILKEGPWSKDEDAVLLKVRVAICMESPARIGGSRRLGLRESVEERVALALPLSRALPAPCGASRHARPAP